MLIPLLFILVPVLSALLALGLAGFVLSRNWQAWGNRFLATGLLVVALYQGSLLAASLIPDVAWRLGLFRLALGVAALLPHPGSALPCPLANG
jgi:hypothetical protein